MDMEDFSRTTELEFDASKAQLGSKPPKKIGKGSDRAHFKDIGKWAVESRVVQLQHGTYEGKAATLIVFNFVFRYKATPSSLSRLVGADIRLSFDPHLSEDSDSTVGTNGPSVVIFCPKLLHGRTTVVERETEISMQLPLGIAGGIIPMQAGTNIGRVDRRRFEEIQRMTVKGEAYSTEEREETHLLVWTIRENPAQKEGIPTSIKLAAVVQNDGRPFQGSVRLQARAGAKFKLFGMPWSRASSLVLRPNITLGSPVTCSEFDKFTDDDWKSLINFSYPLAAYQMTRASELVEIYCRRHFVSISATPRPQGCLV